MPRPAPSVRDLRCGGAAAAPRTACTALQASCKRACKTEAVEEGLELRVLGSIGVLRGGRPLAIGGPKPRLLLAMLLAFRGTMVSSARLCEELWGDDPPADPGGVLQSHVSRLRRLLRPDAEIAARPPGYVLQLPDAAVDAGRFESWFC